MRREQTARGGDGGGYQTLLWVLTFMSGLLMLKVAVGIVLNYHEYLPPNFQSDFLTGRESYFWGGYQWAFYAHLASGPTTLILGLVLVSNSFRQRFPQWHRCLGRVQIASVLLVLTPSGLWMAQYAATGTVAACGFTALSIMTALCAMFGWRAAVRRQFQEHRNWMWRCFLLLCSAVVLRLMAGLATVLDVEGEWVYPLAAWTSWLVPLLAFEVVRFLGCRKPFVGWQWD